MDFKFSTSILSQTQMAELLSNLHLYIGEWNSIQYDSGARKWTNINGQDSNLSHKIITEKAYCWLNFPTKIALHFDDSSFFSNYDKDILHLFGIDEWESLIKGASILIEDTDKISLKDFSYVFRSFITSNYNVYFIPICDYGFPNFLLIHDECIYFISHEL